MGFNSSYGSNQQAKRASPRIQSAPKSCMHYDQFEDVSECQNASFCRKKDDAFSPDSKVEDTDTDTEKQLHYIKGLSDDADFMWLSSNCKSPSIFSSDDSQDYCQNLTVHENFSSMLSLSGSYDVIFDGSRISPIDEASLLLDRPLEVSDGGDLEEEVTLWLHNAIGSEIKNSSAVCSESGDSSYDRSFCEDSSLFESSSTSVSTQEGTPLFVRNFDRTGIWVSSLDLDVEDSKLVHDEERGFDIFNSDFPSPSFSARQKHRSGLSSSSSATSFGQGEEVESSSKVCDSDEPLFWPFDQTSWLPEFEKNFLCLSPRKRGMDFAVNGLNSLKSFLQKNSLPAARKSMREECRRRIVFSPPPKSVDGKHNTGTPINKNIQNIRTPPSRLSRSSQTSLKKSPCNISKTERTTWLDAKSQKHKCDEQLLDTPLLELETSNFQVLEGDSIEKMVGLNEFDGHEGLKVESEEDEYPLNGSPFKMTVSAKDIKCTRGNNPVSLGSCPSTLIIDDCSRSHFEGHEDLNDVKLSEPRVQGC